MGLVFRQHPAWSLLFVAGAALPVSLGPLALRDPEFRAAVFLAVNPLTSAKFLVVTLLIVLGCLIYVPLASRVVRGSLTFRVTARGLTATHHFSRRRREIPWPAITAVVRMRPSFLNSGARLQFSRIEATGEPELVFSSFLPRYEQFVEELRRRTTCRVFDPAPPWQRRQ